MTANPDLALTRRRFLAACGTAFGCATIGWAEKGSERELLRDPRFRNGFRLIEPPPGKRLVYGELPGLEREAKPAWDLDQWSSKFPLQPPQKKELADRSVQWANEGKTVTLGPANNGGVELSLRVNALAEYGGRARKQGEPWVHLLVEQEIADAPSLARLASARFRISVRLAYFTRKKTEDYSPGLHAAQFQMFFTVQNRNRQSPGYGKLLWFGIPLYDDRHRIPPEHKTQDTGGTEMFIFTPDGGVYTRESAHDRQWISVDKDLAPLMREALETAWAKGFLRESRAIADYHITTTNLGWEVPGLFDVEMGVRDLSLKVVNE